MASAVPVPCTTLLQHLPGHRTLSSPYLQLGGSTGARPRTRASTVTALDAGSLTLPQRADHTAVPELEGHSRHEDKDSRPPSARTCQEPPVPSSTSAPPCGGHGPQDWHLLASSLLLHNCLRQEPQGIFAPRHERHPRRPSQSLGDTETPFANTRIQPTLVGFSLVNAPRQPKRLPRKTTAWRHTAANLRRPPL